ncbi:hypothetical protein IKW73_02825 [Candidatus Saccharibacteria bacterium]|nr:hypothetical protein [Candidatus Saccharibacteria bacterium]
MKYLAVLGRQPEISIAELTALFSDVKKLNKSLATFIAESVDINRLGGSIKIAEELSEKPLEILQKVPGGKITIGVSDYSKNASTRSAKTEALKLKQILVRHGRSVRVVESREAALPTATSLHNGLSGKNERKFEFIKVDNSWYRVVGVQDIDAYTKRDQARPARDAKVGMLPPKLAQILINLCGPLPAGSCILDPFCGTGVVLQEALLMGYSAYGTDLSERMVEYTQKNLEWLILGARSAGPSPRAAAATPRAAALRTPSNQPFQVSQGDATTFQWEQPIDAVACEGYLGAPMSTPPAEIKLKEQKQECGSIVLGFLKNLASQIDSDTPVVIAAPAWLRSDGTYSRLEIVDEIANMGYNVMNKSREGLLYHREDQIVARDIIILRKK